MNERVFFIDPSRCISCRTCEAACASRDGHDGFSMIHFTTSYPGGTAGSFAQVCMHCEDPLCARVCGAEAIRVAIDGTVLGVDRQRCTGCKLCVEACPFGVPMYVESLNLAMKCDMCYDRCLGGEKPMCATACPTGALAFTTVREMEQTRRCTVVREWCAAGESIRTKAGLVFGQGGTRSGDGVYDIAAALEGADEETRYGEAGGAQ